MEEGVTIRVKVTLVVVLVVVILVRLIVELVGVVDWEHNRVPLVNSSSPTVIEVEGLSGGL